MPFAWEHDYSRDHTVWSEHGEPMDCIAVLRHELLDERMRAVEFLADQTRRAVLAHDDRIKRLEHSI